MEFGLLTDNEVECFDVCYYAFPLCLQHSKMESPEDDEMKQLCLQLDCTLDNFFQTLNKLLATRQELDKTVKEGFYLMARVFDYLLPYFLIYFVPFHFRL